MVSKSWGEFVMEPIATGYAVLQTTKSVYGGCFQDSFKIVPKDMDEVSPYCWVESYGKGTYKVTDHVWGSRL